VASALAARAAPAGSVVSVAVTADDVRVTVTAEVAPLGSLPLRTTVQAEAVAQREPGTAGDAPGGAG
jgi:hypothetical protein